MTRIRSLFVWSIPLAFLGVFYFYPILSILTLSLNRSTSGVVTPFLSIIQSPSLMGVIGFTFWQATFSTIVTLIFGLPGAYLFARFKFPGKAFLRAITGVPFVMPTIIVAAAFNALLGPKGWINILLMEVLDLNFPPIEIINTYSAIILAHVFYNTTIVLRMVGDFWSKIDMKIGQSAATLGANTWQIFSKITLPLLIPVISAAALLVFIFDFSSFGVILILGGPQFSSIEVEIYYQTISIFNLPIAAALSIIQLCFTILLTFVYTKIVKKTSKYLPRRSKTQNYKAFSSWQSKFVAIIVIGCLLVFLTSPLIALASKSIYSLETRRDRTGVVSQGLTLDFYRELSKNKQESIFYSTPISSIGISLGYAGITVILSLIIGLPTAWVVIKNWDSIISRILNPIIMLPLGTSAVTLGLGFILALSRPPLDLRSSPVLVPIAHTLVAFPFVVRTLSPAMRAIQPGIREAAAVLGANPFKILLKIDLPLVGKAIIAAASFAFTISIGEFGATALISRPEFPTIPVAIYRFLSRPGGINYGQAIALSTILMFITVLGMLIIEQFRISDEGDF